MKRAMTNVGIVYYLTIFMVGMIIGMIVTTALAQAACLTAEQTSALYNISAFFNMSNSTLVSAFEFQCNQTANISIAANSLNSSFTLYKNQTDASLGTLAQNISELSSSMLSNMSSIFSSTNINAIAVANATKAGFETLLLHYQDTVDDRIENYKKAFMTNEVFEDRMENQSSLLDAKLAGWEQYAAENYSSARMFWMWLFFGAVTACGGMVYLVRYHPEKASFITGVKATRRSMFEISTPSEFKSKIGRVRELKMVVAKYGGVPLEEKQLLMNKIDADEIKDEAELEAELEILKGMRKTAKPSKAHPASWKKKGKN